MYEIHFDYVHTGGAVAVLGADGAPNKHRVLGRDVGARRGASREGPPPRRLPPVCVVVARAPREGQAAHHTQLCRLSHPG